MKTFPGIYITTYHRMPFGCYSPDSTTGGQTTPTYAPGPGRRYVYCAVCKTRRLCSTCWTCYLHCSCDSPGPPATYLTTKDTTWTYT